MRDYKVSSCHCPNCGAPASSAVVACDYCGSVLEVKRVVPAGDYSAYNFLSEMGIDLYDIRAVMIPSYCRQFDLPVR